MIRIRKIDFDERATVVDHLDELRNRLIAAAAVLAVAFGLAFWQNHLLLDVANAPLPNGREPITFGVTEPFMTTVKISVYAGLILALPALIYLAAGFVLPALAPAERRTIVPFLVGAPALFIAGVVFSYFVVVPAAAQFLLNFNQGQFNIQVRASEYYGFFASTLLALGLVFEVPVAILAVTRLGLITSKDLSRNRRYAVLACAVVAMLLPGTDPVTMLICMAPLLVLFELSVQLSKLVSPSSAQGSSAGRRRWALR
jgi:sec-independent protein translocase protein TatC